MLSNIIALVATGAVTSVLALPQGRGGPAREYANYPVTATCNVGATANTPASTVNWDMEDLQTWVYGDQTAGSHQIRMNVGVTMTYSVDKGKGRNGADLFTFKNIQSTIKGPIKDASGCNVQRTYSGGGAGLDLPCVPGLPCGDQVTTKKPNKTTTTTTTTAKS